MNLEPDSFDFLIDVTTRNHVVLGLKVNVVGGSEYVIPMNLETAQDVGSVLLGHVAALHATTRVQ